MGRDPFTQQPERTDQAEQLRDKLQEIREKDPGNYALRSTRIIREINRLSAKRFRYAKT